jgi:hypothetical protein
VPPLRVCFLLAKKLLPDCVHPFQLPKPILDRCAMGTFFMFLRITCMDGKAFEAEVVLW